MVRLLLGTFVLAAGIVAAGVSADGSRGPLPLGRESSRPTLTRGPFADHHRGGDRLAARPVLPVSPPYSPAPSTAETDTPE